MFLMNWSAKLQNIDKVYWNTEHTCKATLWQHISFVLLQYPLIATNHDLGFYGYVYTTQRTWLKLDKEAWLNIKVNANLKHKTGNVVFFLIFNQNYDLSLSCTKVF